MQLLNVSNLPIYLPNDTAPVPFGDPFSDAAITLASPGVFTVPGYVPTNGDAIAFSVYSTGVLPVAIVAGTKYFVVGAVPATGAFNVAATKGGAAINTATASTAPVTAHLLSAEVDGVVLPFKSGNTVLVENNTGGALVLQGAPDVNATGAYGNPGGPGSFVTLATVAANSRALVVLSQDWIRVSTAATLSLVQN
jgi:hypothetical protein